MHMCVCVCARVHVCVCVCLPEREGAKRKQQMSDEERDKNGWEGTKKGISLCKDEKRKERWGAYWESSERWF